MPRPKSQPQLECQVCFRAFKSSWGLTQHYNSKHPRISSDSSTSQPTFSNTTPITAVAGIPPEISDIPSRESPILFENNYDSDSDDSDSDSDSNTSTVDINGESSLPEQIKHEDILPHHQAGYTYPTERSSSTVFDI